ncbi:VanZ family protein [Streptomyces calidiresistens]|uniref:VanZ family protein n=1 Tax=Streptomyces calidiresistens TaxID=1485586 RepID=UPI0015F88719|nr:VanZ family protein [Streptomyces calidiresistens]
MNQQFHHSITTLQGVLNVGMFMPVGFFTLLATRNFLLSAAGPAVLSFAIEITQGVAPFIARACDTTDWVSNSLGGALGAFLAYGYLRIRGVTAIGLPGARDKRIGLTLVAVVAGFGIVGRLTLMPLFTDATGVWAADDDMREAAREKAESVFGEGVVMSRVHHLPGVGGPPDTVTFNAEGANFSMEWPDTRRFQMYIGPWQKEFEKELSFFAVEGFPREPTNENDARKIAEKFASDHFPWALRESDVEVYPMDESGQLGWMVNWRRYRDEILMPMRFDVQVDSKGYIAQFIAADIDDPESELLPPVRITEEQARNAVLEESFEARLGEGEMILSEVEGEWRILWLLPDASGLVFAVNAETGLLEREAR